MMGEETIRAAKDTIYLAGCAVNGTVPDRKRLEGADLAQIYRTSSRHMLVSAVASALESAGVRNDEFAQAKNRAIRRALVMTREKDDILPELEKQGIWYMPLKGAVIKDLYPAPGMREFSDIDILFDAERNDDVRKIMEEKGFTLEISSPSQDAFEKPPISCIEMHRGLFAEGDGQLFYRYYRDIRSRLIKDEGNEYGYHFSLEDFYVFLIAHEYKHYQDAGTGLRNLLDIYLYEKHYGDTLNRDYIAAETEKLGLSAFERESRDLALKLFREEELSPEEQEMLEYMIDSGVYGTAAHSRENFQKRYSELSLFGKLRYKLKLLRYPVSRNNPGYEDFAAAYPLFYRHRALLPLLFFYRIWKHFRGK